MDYDWTLHTVRVMTECFTQWRLWLNTAHNEVMTEHFTKWRLWLNTEHFTQWRLWTKHFTQWELWMNTSHSEDCNWTLNTMKIMTKHFTQWLWLSNQKKKKITVIRLQHWYCMRSGPEPQRREKWRCFTVLHTEHGGKGGGQSAGRVEDSQHPVQSINIKSN